MVPNKKLAKHLAIRELPSLVYEAVNLEGIAITLPEVQTILDGITVGGHKISDQNMVINQANTWKHLFKLVDDDRFEFSKSIALALHNIAGKEEAFEWGVFRSGNVTRITSYNVCYTKLLRWTISTYTTVSYGDIYPVTTGGKIFTSLMLMLGIGIIAIPTGLIASALTKTKDPKE